MSWSDLRVEFSFADPFETPTWVDVTSRVLSVSTRHGRQDSSGEFDAGRATVVLDNADREFDPLNESSSHHGDLVPNRRLRVRLDDGPHLWEGFVDGWPQSYRGQRVSQVTVRATDAFKLLRRAELPESVYALAVLESEPVAWWRMRDTAGNALTDSSGHDRHATLGDASQDLSDVDSGGSLLRSEDGGTIELTSLSFLAGEARRFPSGFTVGDEWTIEWWMRVDFADWLTADIVSLGGAQVTASSGPSQVDESSWQISCRVQGSSFFLSSDSWIWRVRREELHQRAVHCVMTGSTAGGVQLWMNADEVTLEDAGEDPPSVDVADVQLCRAHLIPDDSSPSQHHIGDIAVYDRRLNTSEIAAHFVAGRRPWSGDSSSERIVRLLEEIDWPDDPAWRDIDSGGALLGLTDLTAYGSALAALQTIEATEQGALHVAHHTDGAPLRWRSRDTILTAERSTESQWTLTDQSGGGVHYEHVDIAYDEAQIVNECTVRFTGGAVTERDEESTELYGVSSRSIDTEIVDRIDAQRLARWVVSRRAHPSVRVRSVTLNPAAYAAAWDVAVGARVGDRVTVVHTPPAGSQITVEALVEGVEHQIEGGRSTWTTTLRLSTADAGPWWRWDHAEWGETTRWSW